MQKTSGLVNVHLAFVLVYKLDADHSPQRRHFCLSSATVTLNPQVAAQIFPTFFLKQVAVHIKNWERLHWCGPRVSEDTKPVATSLFSIVLQARPVPMHMSCWYKTQWNLLGETIGNHNTRNSSLHNIPINWLWEEQRTRYVARATAHTEQVAINDGPSLNCNLVALIQLNWVT